MTLFKILLILNFGIIFLQDYKNRMVHWFWYPLVGVFGFLVQTYYIDYATLAVNSAVNLLLIFTVLLILWVYTKLILHRKLINESIGIGDVLFFIFLSFCFSIISFFVLFVFSLLFSLLLHFALKSKNTISETIPLAGYMSLFFALVYGLTFFINCNFIFAY